MQRPALLAILITLSACQSTPRERALAPVYRGETIEGILELAAEGDVEAQIAAANFYYTGRDGLPEDRERAARWFAAAAQAGSADAQYGLAVLLEQGEAGERNEAEAADWYAEAA
ncbi:MAG: hypothetical protein ACYSWX_09040, partial [Planctomycetota bacterium]